MNTTWIITTFVPIDTAMTNLDHQTDVRAKVPDSEIVTVALVAAKYFAYNHHITLGGIEAFVTSDTGDCYGARMLYQLSFQLRKISSQNVCNLLTNISIIQPKTPFCCS